MGWVIATVVVLAVALVLGMRWYAARGTQMEDRAAQRRLTRDQIVQELEAGRENSAPELRERIDRLIDDVRYSAPTDDLSGEGEWIRSLLASVRRDGISPELLDDLERMLGE